MNIDDKRADLSCRRLKRALIGLVAVCTIAIAPPVVSQDLAKPNPSGAAPSTGEVYSNQTKTINYEAINTVYVGSTKILLPAPEGFFRYDGKSSKVDQVQGDIMSKRSRLLAALGSRANLDDVLTNAFPNLERYFVATTHRELERFQITDTVFTSYRSKVRMQIAVEFEKAREKYGETESTGSAAWSKGLQIPVKLEVGGVIPLGVFDETSNSISLSTISKILYRVGDAPSERVLVAAHCSLNVRQKIIELMCISRHRSELDMGWVRSQLKKWRDAVVLENAKD